MQHERHAPGQRGKTYGERHVPAKPEDHVRVPLTDEPPGPHKRAEDRDRGCYQRVWARAIEALRPYPEERDARLWDKAGLEPLRRAGERYIMPLGQQTFRDRQRRIDVTRRPATAQQYPHSSTPYRCRAGQAGPGSVHCTATPQESGRHRRVSA